MMRISSRLAVLGPAGRMALGAIVLILAGSGAILGVKFLRQRAITVDFTTSNAAFGDALDIFLYDKSTGDWLINYGTGSAEPQGRSSGRWDSGWEVSAANFNNDGLADLYIYSFEQGSWYKVIGTPEGFVYHRGSFSPGWQSHVQDLNGDQKTDLFLYNESSGACYEWFTTSESEFSCPKQGAWSPGWEIFPGRFSRDSLTDFFLYNKASGSWYKVIDSGGSDFDYSQSGQMSPGWEVTVADFSQDGLSDLLVYNPEVDGAASDTSNWFALTSTDQGFATDAISGKWSAGWTVITGQFNADNAADLILHNKQNGSWFTLLFDRSRADFDYHRGRWDANWQVSTTDINSDRLTDLLLYNPQTGAAVTAIADGSGDFSYRSLVLPKGMTVTISEFGVPPLDIESLTADRTEIAKGETVTFSWAAQGYSKLTLNPGNIDVTRRTSFGAAVQSSTLFNITAQAPGGAQISKRVFVKVRNELPEKMSVLWLGPWFRRNNTQTLGELRNDFGAKVVMYSVDSLFGNWNSTPRAFDLEVYNEFCRARIAEAPAANTYLFWQIVVPFEKKYSADYKRQALNQLRPCFDSPWVLGIHNIDEVSGNVSLGHTDWDQQSMQEGYNLFKEIYPSKLVWQNESQDSAEKIRGWDWTDIFSMDFYPYFFFPDHNTSAWSGAMTASMNIVKEVAAGRDAWFVHQGIVLSGDSSPNPDELQYFADLTWQNGLQGIAWWGPTINPRDASVGFEIWPWATENFIPDESFKAALRQINGNAPQLPVPTPQPVPVPIPAPTPVPQPTPQPTPTPAPVPAPQPVPVPSPQPSPAPVPIPIPSPSPVPTPAPTPAPAPVPPPPPPPPIVNSVAVRLTLQGRQQHRASGTITFYDLSGNSLGEFELSAPETGRQSLNINLLAQPIRAVIKPDGYLSRAVRIDLEPGLTVDFGSLKAGDLNNDNRIDALDVARLAQKWFQADSGADLTGDGIVNSLDYSLLRTNWNSTGD